MKSKVATIIVGSILALNLSQAHANASISDLTSTEAVTSMIVRIFSQDIPLHGLVLNGEDLRIDVNSSGYFGEYLKKYEGMLFKDFNTSASTLTGDAYNEVIRLCGKTTSNWGGLFLNNPSGNDINIPENQYVGRRSRGIGKIHVEFVRFIPNGNTILIAKP